MPLTMEVTEVVGANCCEYGHRPYTTCVTQAVRRQPRDDAELEHTFGTEIATKLLPHSSTEVDAIGGVRDKAPWPVIADRSWRQLCPLKWV